MLHVLIRSSLVLVAVVASACATGAASAAKPDSGVRGQALYGPTCPVERVGQRCERPYQTVINVSTLPGRRLVARMHTQRNGHFSVRLAPGRYVLTGAPGHPFPRAPVENVTVDPHRFTVVTLRFDSGIR